MERLLPRLEEKRKTPKGANDKELEQLIEICKKHLGVKDEDARQTASPEPPGLRYLGAVERSPPETGKETTGKRIVDCGANIAALVPCNLQGKAVF